MSQPGKFMYEQCSLLIFTGEFKENINEKLLSIQHTCWDTLYCVLSHKV